MAYTIQRTNPTAPVITVQDGSIDTTSTSLSLPGRNFAGYGQALDSNFVNLLENFANTTPPPNPITGQLWYNTTTGILNMCPADGTITASSWLQIASTNSGGQTTVGNLTVTSNASANNLTIGNIITGNSIGINTATVSNTFTANVLTATTGNIPTITTTNITTGDANTAGTLTGAWTINGSNVPGGNAFSIVTGNVSFTSASQNGIKCDNYMYANGVAFNPSGSFTTSNVFAYLDSGTFNGNISPARVTTAVLSGSSGAGQVQGVWTLGSGARFQATYADLAERFEADDIYEVGTVVELGGDKEITAVVDPLCDSIFGVISDSAAYLMNGAAGTNETHPAVAMSGRVPVKVVGKIKKGDRLVSAGKGMARAAIKSEVTPFNTIGRALANKTTSEVGTIEAIVVVR